MRARPAELGFNQMTCYLWVHKTRLPERVPLNREAGQRKHTPAQKAEFFIVFNRIKSTTRAARELGLNPNTCAAWVRKAGLKCHGKRGRVLIRAGTSTSGCARPA